MDVNLHVLTLCVKCPSKTVWTSDMLPIYADKIAICPSQAMVEWL